MTKEYKYTFGEEVIPVGGIFDSKYYYLFTRSDGQHVIRYVMASGVDGSDYYTKISPLPKYKEGDWVEVVEAYTSDNPVGSKVMLGDKGCFNNPNHWYDSTGTGLGDESHFKPATKPEPKPFTQETFPYGAMFKFLPVGEDYFTHKTVGVYKVEIGACWHSYEELLKGAEYSLDGCKTWHKCQTEL